MGSNEPSSFELLNPSLRRQLWKMGWPALRPLQEKSIRQIIELDGHVILMAATASGKTEAAFLPVLSRIIAEPAGSVRAIYVGPLKALINDQFGRLEQLCESAEVPVHRWHGDVGAADKSTLVDSPGGVLLITPESLESLLINRSRHLARLFAGLRYIVIDELHSFLDSDRGLHLRSLLMRISSIANPRPRWIGLSATIGDPVGAQQWIDAKAPAHVAVLSDISEPRETRYRLHGYRVETAAPSDGISHSAADGSAPGGPAPPDPAQATDQQLAGDLLGHCAGNVNLVFANSKADVEVFAELCARLAAEQHLPDRFVVHHGSLSAEARADAEAIMKTCSAATAICSSTLEMGIDIGKVRMVGQIGAPASVASLKQRLGRSGRRAGEPRMLRVYMRCPIPGEASSVFDRLHLNLIQAVAVSELLLRGWVEPPRPARCDLSTLSQQIMSVVAQQGSATAGALYEALCRDGPFSEIEPALFSRLLRALAEKDIISQMQTGELILGLAGERLRADRSFYAVFQSARKYQVIAGGTSLGELSIAPTLNDHILFAGRQWQVVDVDPAQLRIVVKPAASGARPMFLGEGASIHPEIHREMSRVLASEKVPAYLDATALALLESARAVARQYALCAPSLADLGDGSHALMTWAGGVAQQTLAAMFLHVGLTSSDAGVALLFRSQKRAGICAAIDRLRRNPPSAQQIVMHIRPRIRRKYDGLLTDQLLDECIARDRIDLAGARAVLEHLCADD